MRFIGDVHGHIENYLDKIRSVESSFQVGDIGLGFEGVFLPKLDNHWFIRGNHDDPKVCREHHNYAGDYNYWQDKKMFYIGGAYSIDGMMRRHYQKETGRAIWWDDEELSIHELELAYKLYASKKPEIVVSHDAPDTPANYLLNKIMLNYSIDKKIPTRTGKILEKMFHFHQPKTWIFGHYHFDNDFIIEGTRFICLGELSYIDLPV